MGLWLACVIFIWVIYHKIFMVIYFDLFNGLLKEIIVCGFLGTILMMLIMKFLGSIF